MYRDGLKTRWQLQSMYIFSSDYTAIKQMLASIKVHNRAAYRLKEPAQCSLQYSIKTMCITILPEMIKTIYREPAPVCSSKSNVDYSGKPQMVKTRISSSSSPSFFNQPSAVSLQRGAMCCV